MLVMQPEEWFVNNAQAYGIVHAEARERHAEGRKHLAGGEAFCLFRNKKVGVPQQVGAVEPKVHAGSAPSCTQQTQSGSSARCICVGHAPISHPIEEKICAKKYMRVVSVTNSAAMHALPAAASPVRIAAAIGRTGAGSRGSQNKFSSARCVSGK